MKPHRATLILVLGILSIVGACVPLGIAAWIMGNADLRLMNAGQMDPTGRDTTKIGKILGIIGTALFAVAVVVGIIMMTWVVFGTRHEITHGKEVRTRADLDAFNSALVVYQSRSLRYPTSEQGLEALVVKPASAPDRWSRLMEQIYPDPWGHDYYYYYPGKKNGTAKPDVGSCGPDGIEGNNDDIGNWTN